MRWTTTLTLSAYDGAAKKQAVAASTTVINRRQRWNCICMAVSALALPRGGARVRRTRYTPITTALPPSEQPVAVGGQVDQEWFGAWHSPVLNVDHRDVLGARQRPDFVFTEHRHFLT